MNQAQAQAALAAISMSTLLPAYRAATGDTTSTVGRAQVIQALAVRVAQGQITVADVRSGGAPALIRAQVVDAPAPAFPNPGSPVMQTMAQPAQANPGTVRLAAQVGATELEVAGLKVSMATVAAEIQSLDQRLANLGQQQAGANARLGQLGSDVAALAGRVETASTAAQAETKSLRAQVQALANSVGTMPVDEMRAAMRQAVADAWGPVRAAAEANGTESDVRAQVAGPAGRASALDVFGIDARDARGRPLMFSTWADTAPPVDSCHIWTEPVLRMLALAEATGRNAWLAGPAGVGKSQTVQQYAARTGRAFERFQMHKLAGVDDFLGTTGIKGGDTQFEMGPILRAFVTPGSVCLIDEPATGSPAVMAVLNGLLEPGHPRISHGENVYTRATGNLFFGADNSNGQGDTGGRFAGVQQMNTATMDRFSFVVPLSYLDPSDESAALVRHTGCTQALADHVILAFTVARAKVETGDLIDPPTFRQAIGFVQACSVLPVAQAWQVTIAARQPTESQVALAAIYSASIDETLITTEAA
jgi:cobaltochelatase CobS